MGIICKGESQAENPIRKLQGVDACGYQGWFQDYYNGRGNGELARDIEKVEILCLVINLL